MQEVRPAMLVTMPEGAKSGVNVVGLAGYQKAMNATGTTQYFQRGGDGEVKSFLILIIS